MYINYLHTIQNYTYYKLYTPQTVFNINCIKTIYTHNTIYSQYKLLTNTTIYYPYKPYTHIYYTQLILNTNHIHTHHI